MKILLLFYFLLSPNLSIANSLITQFEDAILKNQFSLIVDLYDEYEEELKNNIKARFYLARALEGLGQDNEAIKIFEKILKINYSSLTKNISKKAFRGKKYQKFVPKDLEFIFFKLAQLYTNKYRETHEETDPNQRKIFFKKSLAYIRLSRSVTEESENIDEQQEVLQAKLNYFNDLKYRRNIYFYTGIIAWQDTVKVNDSSNGTIPLLNTSRGNCLGFGVSWQNIRKEYFIDGCYINAKSTVDSALSTYSYNQSNVPVSGFFGGPGISWKTFAENLSLGTQFVILSRTGTWDSSNSSQAVDLSRLTVYGLSLQTKWNFWKFSIIGRFARLLNTKSSTISINSAFNF